MSLEIARHTRNAVLREEQVKIKVPPRSEMTKPSNEWAKVLGALAAVYSIVPSPRPLSGERFKALHPLTASDGADVEQVAKNIEEALSLAIKRRDVGEIVRFSAPSRLIKWAQGQLTDSYFTLPDGRISAKKASAVVTEGLTERGIETFANTAIGAAVLLTELFSNDEQFENNTDLIRNAVRETGYQLLIPPMASEDFFNYLGEHGAEKELADKPRDEVFSKGKRLIKYKLSDRGVSRLRWEMEYPDRGSSAGCPFLMAEKGKAVKIAWQIAVDTMWDDLLAWRVKTAN